MKNSSFEDLLAERGYDVYQLKLEALVYSEANLMVHIHYRDWACLQIPCELDIRKYNSNALAEFVCDELDDYLLENQGYV